MNSRCFAALFLLCFGMEVTAVHAQSLPTLGRVKGKFYIVVDNSAKVFLNGVSLLEAQWEKGKVHESREIEIAPNDRLLLHLSNAGGPKGVFLAFISTDRKHVVSFKATDFKMMLATTMKDVPLREIEGLPRTAQPGKSGKGNPFPFECQSEWLWGAAERCAVVGVIRKEMFQSVK